MTMVELDYICDLCGQPIEDGDGALCISYTALRDARAAVAEDPRLRTPQGALDLVAFLTLPGVVPWNLFHDRCGSSANGYDIDVAKIRTWRALLLETSRLMAKDWVPLTDWPHVVGAAAEGESTRIVEFARGGAA